MLDVRYSHLYFYQSLNRLQRGLSAIAELLVMYTKSGHQIMTQKFTKNISYMIQLHQLPPATSFIVMYGL